ncbi:uncharacterized protein METZ01_LOCUS261071 [marine metagenome]|uniref:Uncharacterized protein n=1 Tax=marine metagenome TaxID=408172 RepID=A0A382JA97_9ZZZZ
MTNSRNPSYTSGLGSFATRQFWWSPPAHSQVPGASRVRIDGLEFFRSLLRERRRVAQLGERFPDAEEVVGSSPAAPTSFLTCLPRYNTDSHNRSSNA